MLCFTQSYVEVRTRFTGRLVQTVELAGAAYQARIGDELFLTARHGDRSSIHRLAVVAQEGFKEEIAVLHRASGSIAAAVATLDAGIFLWIFFFFFFFFCCFLCVWCRSPEVCCLRWDEET